MPEPLAVALADLSRLLTDPYRLVRAVGSGRRRTGQPRWRRVELRPVTVSAGPRLQVVEHGERPRTRNVAWGTDADAAVAELLAEPYGNWHVTGTEQTVQLRVTKRGDAQVHRSAGTGAAPDTRHDRAAEHLLAPDDELYAVIGGNAAKRRQVDAFLRALDAELTGVPADRPLRMVDLGCGNAYLTFAAYRYLTARRGLTVDLTGVDVRDDQRDRNAALAGRLGWSHSVRFRAGTIATAPVSEVDVVLALHACDTASDDAIAHAVRAGAGHLLVAPCCQHDLAAQLRAKPSGEPLLRNGILRERFADTLTDALRAELLRAAGYAVDVVEFVDSRHTPRNLLLRARRAAGADRDAALAAYRAEARRWGVRPYLASLLEVAA